MNNRHQSHFNGQANPVIEIEELYPTPSLGLDEPIVVQIKDHLSKLFKPLAAVILPKVPRNVLSEVSAEYFQRTRKERLGKSLDEIEKEKGGEKAWKEAEGHITEVAELLKKHGGPFFLGNRGEHLPFIVADPEGI